MTEPGGVPVEHEATGEGTAEEQEDEVAVKGTAFAGGGHVVERHPTVSAGDAPDLPDGPEEGSEFAPAPGADVRLVAGKRQIDVVKFDLRGDVGQRVEQGLHHKALAVDRRGSLRENEQLHRGLGM